MSTMHMHDPTTPPTTTEGSTSHAEAEKAVQTLSQFLEAAAPTMPSGKPAPPPACLRRPDGFIHAQHWDEIAAILNLKSAAAPTLYGDIDVLPPNCALPFYVGDPMYRANENNRDADMLDAAADAAKPSVSVSIRLMAEAYGRAMRSDWPAQAESALRDLLFTIQGELEDGLQERDRMLVEFSKLAQPEGVHAAMLAGKIARISLEQCAHTHGESAVKEVLRNAGALSTNQDGERKAAYRTLERLGYTYEGGLEWKPPLGPDGSDPPPDALELLDEALANKMEHMAPVRPIMAGPGRRITLVVTDPRIKEGEWFSTRLHDALIDFAAYQDQIERHHTRRPQNGGQAYPYTTKNGIRFEVEPWITVNASDYPGEVLPTASDLWLASPEDALNTGKETPRPSMREIHQGMTDLMASLPPLPPRIKPEAAATRSTVPTIGPTIGRKVWVFIEPGERRAVTASMTVRDEQPLDATVVWVDPRTGPSTPYRFYYITVRVLDHVGEPKVLTLPLRAPNGEQPDAREWAEWMPYQVGQAGGSK